MAVSIYDKVQEAVRFIRQEIKEQCSFGIVLGTGHNDQSFEINRRIAYDRIPHFTNSTVESHQGELCLTYVNGKACLILSGRFHYYEGLSSAQTAFPIRVLNALGVSHLFITNAVGGLNPSYISGDIVLIKDQINLQPDNPLRGKHDERLGLMFPDMLNAFDKDLLTLAKAKMNIIEQVYYEGVYVGLQGPSLETPAEYQFLNQIKADVVGMSTVPEVITARQCGMKTIVFSVVSNQCFPIHQITETTVAEVIEVVNKTTPKVITCIKKMIEDL